MCLYVQKIIEKKKNIPEDAWHFLSTEIDSTDFRNKNLTAKIGRNKEEKPYLFKKNFQKIFKQTKSLDKEST